MRRIPGRFDVEREFSRKDRLVDFPIPPPPPAVAPGAIYTSPGGKVSEDFLPEPPPPPVIKPPIYSTTAPPAVLPVSLPADAEYITGVASPLKKGLPPGFKGKLPWDKNILDRFFDWLNKILS